MADVAGPGIRRCMRQAEFLSQLGRHMVRKIKYETAHRLQKQRIDGSDVMALTVAQVRPNSEFQSLHDVGAFTMSN